jgi:amino acid adenylation domain-containing protein
MAGESSGSVVHAPASIAQRQLWLLDRMDPGSTAYNVVLAFRLRGQLDRAALDRAFAEIVSRHEVLRTTLAEDGGDVAQLVRREVSPVRLSMAEWEMTGGEDALDRFIWEACSEPFDLAQGRLWRARLARLGSNHHVLVIVLHHAVFDGWSEAVLLGELSTLYGAFRQGRKSPLPALPLQYSDYAVRQREWLGGRDCTHQLEYWRQQLADSPPPCRLSTASPCQAAGRPMGARVWLPLDEEMSASIATLARRERCTPYMVLLTAFAALLSRYTDRQELVIGTAAADRSRPELEKLIGFFVNTLALRLRWEDEDSFLELLKRVRATTLGAWENGLVPFGKAVEQINPERTGTRTPWFRVMFVLQNAPTARLVLEGMVVERLDPPPLAPKFDLILNIEQRAGLRAEFAYDASLFERSAIEAMAEQYRLLLEGALRSPERSVSRLPLLSEAWRRRVVEEWNATGSDYPRSKPVSTLFREQARLVPRAIAIEDGGDMRSYARLDADSDRIAAHLARAGVAPGALVAVCLDRTADAVSALLGILKTGAAYVPLDLAFPAARIAQVLQDAQPVVLVTDSSTIARVTGLARRVLLIEDLLTETALPDCAAAALSADAPAYVLYTSGSTGTPKGVVVPHRAIVRLVRGSDYVQLQPDDRVAQVATLAFDAATFEIWGALLNGARLVIMPRDVSLDADALAAFIRSRGVTTMFLTTALFHEIATENAAAFSPLRQLLFGGEVCDPRRVRAVLEHGAPRRLLHVYGPTENTTFSTWHEVRNIGGGNGAIPIGRPVAGTRVYILDRHMQPVPPGVEGEIHLGGDGLALGYLNDPELTARSFVQTPFGCLYRTGDLAKYRPDGEVEFVGRRDAQVKLRGFRIELGEIESSLSGHAAVREVAVVCSGEGSEKSLVAYVVPRCEASPSQLRAHLQARLPAYMVPASYVFLDRLPLNRNGKVDRGALPAPQRNAAAHADVPQDLIEGELASIWRELLRVGAVSSGDDFFALGGNSLLAVHLVARIDKRLGVRLPVSVLFQSPTLSQLAEKVRRGKCEEGPVLLGPPGSLPPIYFLMAGLYLRDVADAAGAEQRLYAVTPPGEEHLIAPLSLERLAELSVKRLLEVHEDGPFILAGYCYGAILSLEVARQLEELGHPVALVAVIGPPVLNSRKDTDAVQARRDNLAIGRDGLRHTRRLMGLPLAGWRAYLGERLHSTWLRVRHLWWRLLMSLCAALHCPPPMWLRDAVQFLVYAVHRYALRPSGARLVLLNTTEEGMQTDDELRAAWAPLTRNGVEIRHVEGRHDTMFTRAHVASVARELGAAVADLHIRRAET